MARFKLIDRSPRFLPIVLESQLIPGSFEHALDILVDTEIRFLPKPEDLVLQDEGVKITIALSKRSVEFFKREAERHGTQYQRMTRRLLDAYAQHHARPPITRSKERA